MNLHRLRGVSGYHTGMADLHAEPQIRQPRADETVCGPAASPENPLTKTYHTSDQQTTIVNYMRSILKASTLESKFPIMAVEHGCIVSKDADITVAFRVTLPEVFSVSSAEYEAMHAT